MTNRLRTAEFTFDAMELVNSSAQQSDFMLVYRDWFALLNFGYRITAVGSSDGYDVSRYIVGQGRTYIACADEHPGRIDGAGACSSLVGSRALISMGLLTDLKVNNRFRVGDTAANLGPEITVSVQVLSLPWTGATNIILFANGLKLREQNLRGTSETATWIIRRPAHDVHLVAIATGPGVAAPYWAIPRPYQPASPDWNGRVIVSTNPIWLDADGDGHFTAARGYARRLVQEHGAASSKLIAALGQYDEAVAAQVASLCVEAGISPEAPELAAALTSGADQIRRGFSDFAAARRGAHRSDAASESE